MSSIRTRVLRFVTLVSVLGLFVAACGEDATTTTAAETTVPSAAESTDILVLLPNPSAINVFHLCAANGEGFFADEGLEATFQAVDGSAAVVQGLVAGQAEIGFWAPSRTIVAHAEGVEVVQFYNHFVRSVFGLIVPEDSEIQQVTDLVGTTIGVGTADGAEAAFVRSILTEVGLSEGDDYEFLAVGDGGPAAAAFERGDIEAYSATLPDRAIMEARGLSFREITPESFLNFFGSGFGATREYMDSNPEVIRSFVAAALRGREWAEENKEATLAHCAEINPEEGRDTELTSILFDGIFDRTAPKEGLATGEFSLADWELWQQSLIDSGDLAGPLDDIQAVFTNEFVAGP